MSLALTLYSVTRIDDDKDLRGYKSGWEMRVRDGKAFMGIGQGFMEAEIRFSPHCIVR